MASTACDTAVHVAYLTRIADTALVLGQRLCETVGDAPTLEEEMAIANIALDLIGQATMVYEHAATVEGAGRSADDLAYLRDEREFHNLLLVERPNGDFAHLIVRQVLYETYAAVRWQALTESSDEQLAGIAGKAVKETAYHVRHAGDWLARLGDSTPEARERVEAAIIDLWPYAGEALMDDDVDEAVAAAGIAPRNAALAAEHAELLRALFDAATLAVPDAPGWWQRGGRTGDHTEHLGHLLAEMQSLARTHPGASW